MSFIQRLRQTSAVRMEWYGVLASLTRDGMAVADILREMQSEFNRLGHPMAPVVQELLLRIRGGGTARAQGTARNRTIGSELRGLVPTNEALLIETGESTGSISTGFERAKEYVASTNRLSTEVKSAMIGPVLLLLILLAVIVFYSVMVIPEFAQITPRATWPRRAQLYASMADMAIPLSIVLVVGGCVLYLLYVKGLRVWTGSLRDALDQHMWPFTTTAQINSAAMLTSLSGFVGAGKAFADAVQQLESNSDPYMQDVYRRIGFSLRQGKSPPESLSRCHIVPDKFHWIIKLYGRSTDFAASLQGLSVRFMEAAISKTRAAFNILGMLVKLLIVLFAAWTMQTQYDIMQSVKSSTRGVALNIDVYEIRVVFVV